jgi:hypothetical protein
MSTPGKLALALYRGDTNRWRFVLWQDKEKTIPVDLTGVTVSAEIRNIPGGSDVTVAGILVSPPNTIDMTFDIPDSRTVIARGVWDLQLTMPDGNIHTLLAGPVTTTPDVVGSGP